MKQFLLGFWLVASIYVLMDVAGCLSAFHRVDLDQYNGASATYTGNGRTTTMSTSQPAVPAPTPIIQREPNVGQVFILTLRGKSYEAMKKTDGKVYILQEVQK
jgi:hypothetical protein